MHRILVPTDFSTESEMAVMIAQSVARDQNCELIILNVIRPGECQREDLEDGEIRRDSLIFQNSWTRFMRLRPLIQGVKCSLLVKHGQLIDTICDVARNECCDLIVICSSQKSYFQRQLYGSTSESLFRRLPTSVACLKLSPFLQEPGSMLDGLRDRVEKQPLDADNFEQSERGSFSIRSQHIKPTAEAKVAPNSKYSGSSDN
jgi:nucleotide-binding universal stress UspA family protein